MDYAIIIAVDILGGITSLILISLGLAVIYGMMRIINLAHGEFLMLGAYATVVATNAGVNIWIAMLLISPLVVGAIGILVERTVMRFLYGRLIDTMLATWGLSLLISGLVTTVFGNNIKGVPTPLGGFTVGAYTSSLYTLFLAAMAGAMLIGLYLLLRCTRFGLVARAMMQNANMAAALGASPPRTYMITFGIGAAITGLSGGLLAPVTGVGPTIGAAFIAKAFITVVGGGPAILTGTGAAAILFGFINQTATYLSTPVFGEVALFLAAIVLIRLMPAGITGKSLRGAR
ncbi:branched-chain amino acid ABC transporter permease [Taklimakanibacter deserti]|uniref:branched-chain amino acid ABC transporter permease n=1 Tax=Taklimakanibacter deserti TaxID=2267839 RepID=UPI000E655951